MSAALLAGATITIVALALWLSLREARQRGRAEAAVDAATQDAEVARDAQDIVSRPIPDRDALLERMRERDSG